MKQIILVLLVISTFISCSEEIPFEDDLENVNYNLVDQNNSQFNFVRDLKEGTISIVGYIFTNCPDICPLTTNNMRLLQERLEKENIKDVVFYSISFDPEVDSPEVLKKYSEVRELDLSNWKFLTGDKTTIDSLMKRMRIMAVAGDSTVTPSGEKIYYFIHTDRITLIDQNKQVRKEYRGSSMNLDEAFSDIKSLTN